MVPGLHVAVRLPDITACWAGADGPQEGHIMEINLPSTGTSPSKRGGGGGGGLNSECVRIYQYALKTILTTGGSGSDHSAWELGGESHNPDSVCISGSAWDGDLRSTGTTDCSTARVSPSTSVLIVDVVPSGWSASRWWSPRESYGVAASEHSSEASGWAGGSCGIHER